MEIKYDILNHNTNHYRNHGNKAFTNSITYALTRSQRYKYSKTPI
jgi:hypothetical protein